MNSAGAKLFDAKDVDQLIEKSVWDFMPPESKEIGEDRYRQMREKGTEAPQIELVLTRLNGTDIEVEVTAIPFVYTGKPAIQAIFQDISKQIRTRQEVKRRNIELATLNAVVATVSQSLELNATINNALDEFLRLDMLAGEAHWLPHYPDLERTDGI